MSVADATEGYFCPVSTYTDVDTVMVRLDAIPLDEIDVTDASLHAHLWKHYLDRVHHGDPGDRAPEEGVAAFANYV